MDELALNIFTNARKSRVSKKDYDEIPVRDSQKNTRSSKKVSESTISIAKNIDEPKSSQAFRNLMKGVLDLGKRIDNKYSSKNLQPSPPNSKDPQSQSQSQSLANSKWKPNVDKIKEQKNQDDQNREEIGVGTSQQYLGNGYLERPPLRIISPEGSRIVAGPDNSRIIFPPQIVEVRPLVGQPMSPGRVVTREPINRRTIGSPAKVISYSPPPQRTVSPAPKVRFIHEHHPIPQVIQRPVQNIPIHYIHQAQPQPQPQPQAYLYPCPNPYPYANPYPYLQPQQNIIQQLPLQQHIQYLHPNYIPQPQNPPQQSNPTQPTITQTAQQPKQPKQQKTSSPPPSSMTPQQYQALLQKQYQLYNTQNSQLLKHLSQLSQQQKKQYINQQLLQEALKNSSSATVKNVINQKKVTKIVQKNVVNKENIQNVQNVENVRNQVNLCNVANFSNQLSIQDIQGMQAIQYLRQLYGDDPSMANNQILLKQLEMNISNPSAKRLPLQQNPTNSSNRLPSTKSIPTQSAVPLPVSSIPNPLPFPVPLPIPLQQQVSQQKIQKQIFTQILQRDIDRLDIFQENIIIDHHVSDLRDLKEDNLRDAKGYLRKMDQILERYGKKGEGKGKEEKGEKEEEAFTVTLMDKFVNIFSAVESKQPQPTPAPNPAQSNLFLLPETHQKPINSSIQNPPSEPTPINPPQTKDFLTLTKDRFFNFFTQMGR